MSLSGHKPSVITYIRAEFGTDQCMENQHMLAGNLCIKNMIGGVCSGSL